MKTTCDRNPQGQRSRGRREFHARSDNSDLTGGAVWLLVLEGTAFGLVVFDGGLGEHGDLHDPEQASLTSLRMSGHQEPVVLERDATPSILTSLRSDFHPASTSGTGALHVPRNEHFLVVEPLGVGEYGRQRSLLPCRVPEGFTVDLDLRGFLCSCRRVLMYAGRPIAMGATRIEHGLIRPG